MKAWLWVVVLGFMCLTWSGPLAASHARPLAPPEVGARWVRPSVQTPSQPMWGHAHGLRVGLWPLSGPRGLLRVYAPYLGHVEGRMINYIAVEPVVQGTMARGFSELEHSLLDDCDGLRFWSSDTPDGNGVRDPAVPAQGVVSSIDGVEILAVYIFIEPYRNGAEVRLCLTFRADRPYEVGISTLMADGTQPLSACIVTATMGNYARLRTLGLRNESRSAFDLWPTHTGGGFTPHRCFTLDELVVNSDGHALFTASPNEAHPESAAYSFRTPYHWKYTGGLATQVWRSEDPHPLLRGCVNGRTEYWASQSPIPGGIAFENFELVEPFRDGATFWFGVIPALAESFEP